MKTNRLLILIVSICALLLASCSSDDVRVGELRTESKSVELGDAKSARVKMVLGAGDLVVTGGAEKLLEADFTYYVDELKPEVEFSDGTLVVQQPENEGLPAWQGIAGFQNEWDLRLNSEAPMDLKIDMGAGTSDLQLAEQNLTGLVISLGATDSKHWRQNGVPSYVYGCRPGNMAKPDESVDVEEYLHVLRTHALAAPAYLAI